VASYKDGKGFNPGFTVPQRRTQFLCGLQVETTPHLASAAKQVAEKVNSKRLLVAQALLPVLVLPHLPSTYSQEWLCYSTFSATCKADSQEL
jgi:hypothetical protein